VTGDGGVYEARVMSNRYGWWVGCVRASGTGRNTITYRHLDDGLAFERSSCVPRTLPLEISGALTGLAKEESAEVYSLYSATFPFEGTYTVGTESGPAQILASKIDLDFNGVSVLRADLGNLAANATRDIDFAADALPYVRQAITVNGRETGDLVETFSGVYVGDNGMYAPFEAPRENAELLLLPVSQRLAGDRFDITVNAILQTGKLSSRRSAGTLAETIPPSLRLPAAKSWGDATTTESPFSIGWTIPNLEPNSEITALWFGRSRTDRTVITSVSASARWSADATKVDVTELASIPAALGQAPGEGFSWSIDEFLGDFFGGTFASSGTGGEVLGKSELTARRASRAELRELAQARIELRHAR
jgi:hypothetical protein